MKNDNLTAKTLFLIILPLAILSCKKEHTEILPVDPVLINVTSDQMSLISSGNSFAFDIFKRVTGSADGSKNVIISPLSISEALSMTVNGAAGETRDSMLVALRMNGLTPEIINNSYRDLTNALLTVDKRVLISIANSVWTEKNFVVKKPFTDILTLAYSAEARPFDILDPGVPSLVNGWIESKTNGLIKNMIDQLDPQTVMLLINAIYFKGKWSLQFDKTNTVQDSFYKSDGQPVQVPMMKQNAEYKVFKGEGFTLAELPYGQGNFVMDIILPDANNGLNGILAGLNDTQFNSWLNQMSSRKTELFLPRFKYGFKKELKEILSTMGMGIAFTDYADFSNISDLQLKLSLVLHQAFIETNEEGTEAAAATVVGIIFTGAPSASVVMKIDHPFLYIIRETTTNSVLFMGTVADPLAN